MQRFIERYDGRNYDVIIVGGGVTGAAIAYEAASRGLAVALIEKRDFGWATSAATSKMIHGGLRYLYYGELGLVRESLQERRILENIAPNYVYPLPILAPLYKSSWTVRAGLALYDLIAYDKKWTWDKDKRLPNHRMVAADEVMQMAPHVRPQGLESAALYYDCQSSFPERLTLAFIRSAVAMGAHVANHAQALEATCPLERRVGGVKARDLLSGAEVDLRGSLVVNCGGPWADLILQPGCAAEASPRIRRSEGIHFITPKLKSSWGVVLWTDDGRHLFVLPWRGHTLVGTTDKEYNGDPDNYRVTRQSVEELLATLNSCYGDGKLTYDDVVFAYGGLRPLVEDHVEGTYQASRRYEIHDNAAEGVEGLITIEGGKYTTSRNLAEKAMKVIGRKLGRELPPSTTADKPLNGCEMRGVESFVAEMKNLHADFPADTVEVMARNYGAQCGQVLEMARAEPELARRGAFDGEIMAGVAFAVRHEMARTLADAVLRRTGLGALGPPAPGVLEQAADICAAELGWGAEKRRREIDDVNRWLRVPID